MKEDGRHGEGEMRKKHVYVFCFICLFPRAFKSNQNNTNRDTLVYCMYRSTPTTCFVYMYHSLSLHVSLTNLNVKGVGEVKQAVAVCPHKYVRVLRSRSLSRLEGSHLGLKSGAL